MSDEHLSPADLLALHDEGITVRTIAAMPGAPGKSQCAAIIAKAIRDRDDAEHAPVEQALEVAAQAVADDEPEREPAPLDPEPELPDDQRPLVMLDERIGRKMANRLYVRGTSYGKPCVVVHFDEVKRAWRERGGSRLTLTPDLAIVGLIRCNAATPEADAAEFDRQNEAVLKMLDFLANVGVIVPSPTERHLWPVRIQYADGTHGMEPCVLFLKESLDPLFLHQIVYGACTDMARLASDRVIDRRGQPIASMTVDIRDVSPLAPEAMQPGEAAA
jgi:hypothetical protein